MPEANNRTTRYWGYNSINILYVELFNLIFKCLHTCLELITIIQKAKFFRRIFDVGSFILLVICHSWASAALSAL